MEAPGVLRIACLAAFAAIVTGQVTFNDATVSASPTGASVPCTFTLAGSNTVETVQILKESAVTPGTYTDVLVTYNQTGQPKVTGDNRFSSSSLSGNTFTFKINPVLEADGAPTNYKCLVTDSAGTAGLEANMALTVQTGCASSPCKNNATCNDTNLANAWDFECTCPLDYVGTTCDTSVDQCASNPCLNGATCVDGVDEFTCQCTSCYNGTTCDQKRVNYCANSPCKNGATCNNQCDTYKCDCAVNWKGTTCTSACNNIASVTGAQTVMLGSTADLECKVSTVLGTNDKIYWSMKADGSQPYATTAKTTVTVTTAKAGAHYCFVEKGGCISRSNTTISYTYELNVNETQYENVTLQAGESKTFVCSATGTPAPTVQWFFVRSVRRMPGNSMEDANITTATTPPPRTPPAPRAVSNATMNTTTVTIMSASRDDEGTYTCVASIADVRMDVHVKRVTVNETETDPQPTTVTGLQNWEIALIVIGVVVFVALIIIIIVVVLWKTGKAGAICPSDKAGAVEKGDSAPYEKSRDTFTPKKKKKSFKDEGDETDRNDESKTVLPPITGKKKKGSKKKYDSEASPRPLPAPPSGRAPGHLPPLDVEMEKTKKKKKKIKKKKVQEDDEQQDSGNEDNGGNYGGHYDDKEDF